MTDFSGYLIFAVAVVLTLALLFWSPVPLDFSRLFTFTNFTGTPPGDGAVWPGNTSGTYTFLLGLILVCYTITGFDASGHTSEETRNAATEVPKGMIHSVFWSVLFGYFMVCSFVLAMPDMREAANQGFGVFFYVVDHSLMPDLLKKILYTGIVVSNYLCALAGLTSCSRMIFAFARDGGFPLISKTVRKVSPTRRTPGYAILFGAVLCYALGLYVGFDQRAFVALASGCAVALYLSYLFPIAAGLVGEGKWWVKKGPFNLGTWSRPIAVLAIIGGGLLVFIGVQPPSWIVGQLLIALIVLLILLWWIAGERRRFRGPPLTPESVAARQAEIAREEAQIGGAG